MNPDPLLTTIQQLSPATLAALGLLLLWAEKRIRPVLKAILRSERKQEGLAIATAAKVGLTQDEISRAMRDSHEESMA